mmetsp:Transcript_99966/g.285755  ORF Transcript_99966/g.285755 Transcript_99966/m.285755 type:complete len:232 (-) Transcript_99966:7736-8431(-)
MISKVSEDGKQRSGGFGRRSIAGSDERSHGRLLAPIGPGAEGHLPRGEPPLFITAEDIKPPMHKLTRRNKVSRLPHLALLSTRPPDGLDILELFPKGRTMHLEGRRVARRQRGRCLMPSTTPRLDAPAVRNETGTALVHGLAERIDRLLRQLRRTLELLRARQQYRLDGMVFVLVEELANVPDLAKSLAGLPGPCHPPLHSVRNLLLLYRFVLLAPLKHPLQIVQVSGAAE